MWTNSTPSICTCGQIVPHGLSHTDKQYPMDFHIRTYTPSVNFPHKSIDGLAFLPVDLVPEGMAYAREEAPDALGCIVDYFDATCVRCLPNRPRERQATFPGHSSPLCAFHVECARGHHQRRREDEQHL